MRTRSDPISSGHGSARMARCAGDRGGKSSGRGVERRLDRITHGLEVDTTMAGNGLVE